MRTVSAPKKTSRTPAAHVFAEEFDRKINELLSMLADLDARYDQDRAALKTWDGPEAAKALRQRQLEEQHRKAREPHVLALAEVYQRRMSLTLFRSVH
jgi:hypothetical protein